MRLSNSEWQIMNALWESYPATARDIAERLPEDVSWAYTTIKTMLTRLVIKRAVSEHKRGNTSVYEPILTRQSARRSALTSLIDHAFDGAVEPFLSFVAKEKKLSRRQRRELLEALEREDTDSGERT